jgi:hypothetical protein
VSSRGVGRRLSSSRPLPPAILLLLAALAVALGPALGGRIGNAPSDAVASAVVHAERTAQDTAGGDREGAPAAPRRVDLRHPSTGPAAVDRPAFDALLPAVVVAVPLLVLIAGYGGSERRRGLTLPRGSARAPPASAA